MLRADPGLWKALNVERRVWYFRQGNLCLLLAGKAFPLKKQH